MRSWGGFLSPVSSWAMGQIAETRTLVGRMCVKREFLQFLMFFSAYEFILVVNKA